MTLYQHELKNAYIGEVWTPGANTLAYFPLQSDGLDVMGNYTLSNTGTAQTLGRKFTNTSNISPNVTGAKTIMAWVRFNSIDFTKKASLMRCVFYNFNFTITDTDFTQDPCFFLWRNSTLFSSGSNVVTAGNWYLIALTVGTNLVGYINGASYPLSYSGTMSVAADSYYLVSTNASGNVDVTISDCIIESKTWTKSEIQEYYNNTKSNYGL